MSNANDSAQTNIQYKRLDYRDWIIWMRQRGFKISTVTAHFLTFNAQKFYQTKFWNPKAAATCETVENVCKHMAPKRNMRLQGLLDLSTSPDREGMRWLLLWSTTLSWGNKPLITSISSSNHESLWPLSQTATFQSPRHQFCLSVDTISSVWSLANANARGKDNRFLRDIFWLT